MNTFIDRVKDLQNDLLDIQASGKAQVIFRYYGHANIFNFDIYIPKWQNKKEPDFKGDHCLDRTSGIEEFEKTESIVKLLKKLICNEKQNTPLVGDTADNIVHEYTYSRGGTTDWDDKNSD